MSFFKTGKSAKKAFNTEEAREDARRAQMGKAFRFWMKYDSKGKSSERITFLDGELDSDGFLSVPMFFEHQIWDPSSKTMHEIPCLFDPEEHEGEDPASICPLCAAGERATLVGLMTVLHHRKWKDKDGKEHKAAKRLFVAKRATMTLLQKLAASQGGNLTGLTFDVSRSDDRAPRVGDIFIPVGGRAKLSTIANKTGEDASPLKYEKEITKYTAKEILALGLGVHVPGIVDDDEDLSDDDDLPFDTEDDSDDESLDDLPGNVSDSDDSEDLDETTEVISSSDIDDDDIPF